MQCPLCLHTTSITHYAKDKKRDYLQCDNCQLVFVAPSFLPSKEKEKQEYDLHENNFEDEGYRKFLSKVISPITEHITHHDIDKPLTGLDFGCGPAAVLADMLGEQGIQMHTFDPFFANTPEVLQRTYDIVTCTEAIEHFHTPHKEWQQFNLLVQPGSIIVVMTKRVIDKSRFLQWHYKNDPTHVSFFSEATFEFLAQRDGYEVSFPTADIALFKKI